MYTREQLDRRNTRHLERMRNDPEYAERYRARKRWTARARYRRQNAGKAVTERES